MSPFVSGGRTPSRLLTPSKFVVVEGMVAAPRVVWIDFVAVGTLVPDCPGCSGRCDWLPLPLGATGLECIVLSGGDVSLLSGWITVGAPGAPASAGRPVRACPSRRQTPTSHPRRCNSTAVLGER